MLLLVLLFLLLAGGVAGAREAARGQRPAAGSRRRVGRSRCRRCCCRCVDAVAAVVVTGHRLRHRRHLEALSMGCQPNGGIVVKGSKAKVQNVP